MNIKYYLLFIFFILKGITVLVAQNPIVINISIPENVNAGSEFNVNIDVQKNSVNGFAKLELYLPVGFKPKVNETAGSTVINQGQLLKFIWVELPEKNKFNIVISISVDSRIYGYKEIYGNFHYLLNKERKKYPIAVVPLNILNENIKPVIDLSSDIVLNKKVLPEKINNQKTVYRVQIAANKRRIVKEILQELYSVTTAIKEENIDGWYKYTVGDFATKEDADIFRLSCGVSGAFVLKYENGQRIK